MSVMAFVVLVVVYNAGTASIETDKTQTVVFHWGKNEEKSDLVSGIATIFDVAFWKRQLRIRVLNFAFKVTYILLCEKK